jgi:hypothetical protein
MAESYTTTSEFSSDSLNELPEATEGALEAAEVKATNERAQICQPASTSEDARDSRVAALGFVGEPSLLISLKTFFAYGDEDCVLCGIHIRAGSVAFRLGNLGAAHAVPCVAPYGSPVPVPGLGSRPRNGKVAKTAGICVVCHEPYVIGDYIDDLAHTSKEPNQQWAHYGCRSSELPPSKAPVIPGNTEQLLLDTKHMPWATVTTDLEGRSHISRTLDAGWPVVQDGLL